MDQDGFEDLVVASEIIDSNANNPGNINIFLQDSTTPGTFKIPTAYRYGPGLIPYQLAVADIQQDFLPDLVVTGPSESGFRLILHDSENPGSLLPANKFGSLDIACCWTPPGLGDIDLDGLTDVVLVSDREVIYHLQETSNPGSFLSQRTVGEGAGSVAIGDVDGDGLLDLVTFNRTDAQDTILYYRHDASFVGRFLPPIRLQFGFGGWGVKIADIDSDTRMDIIVFGGVGRPNFDFEGRWTVFRQELPNSFSKDPNYRTASDFSVPQAEVVDIDGDGKQDVIVGNRTAARRSNNVQIFSPNDKGSFSEILRVSLPNDLAITTPEIFSIETADLNGNGILDIAVSTHELFVLFQNRSIPGTFASPIRIAGQR